MKFLTEKELNFVTGLAHYLNRKPPETGELAVEVRLIDSNGDFVGTVTLHDGGEYGLVFPE